MDKQQRAIIHSATKVILCVTIDPDYFIQEGYEAIVMGSPIDLAGGPYKLHSDKKTLIKPTDKEKKEAGVEG